MCAAPSPKATSADVTQASADVTQLLAAEVGSAAEDQEIKEQLRWEGWRQRSSGGANVDGGEERRRDVEPREWRPWVGGPCAVQLYAVDGEPTGQETPYMTNANVKEG